MGSEFLLYGYGLVCLSMLVFNILYSAYLRTEGKRAARRNKRVRTLAVPAMAGITDHTSLPPWHIRRMERLLARVNNLLTFDHYLHTLDEKTARQYLQCIAPVLLRLCSVYQKRREETQGAYFCHFIANWGQYLDRETSRLMARQILSFVHRKSLYSRVNGLKAICTLGDADILLDALSFFSRSAQEGLPVHEKIMVEALLTFRGNAGAFIDRLWQQFEQYPAAMQRMILDYIRFQSGDYSEQMLSILQDEKRDKEVRLSAIRYFGRYPDERARDTLLRLVQEEDLARWEYAAISASSLAHYPGRDTVRALSQAMHSANWYVRYNSAASLEQLGFDYEDLLGEAAANDRYAREMLTYRLERRRLQEEQGRKEAATV